MNMSFIFTYRKCFLEQIISHVSDEEISFAGNTAVSAN